MVCAQLARARSFAPPTPSFADRPSHPRRQAGLHPPLPAGRPSSYEPPPNPAQSARRCQSHLLPVRQDSVLICPIHPSRDVDPISHPSRNPSSESAHAVAQHNRGPGRIAWPGSPAGRDTAAARGFFTRVLHGGFHTGFTRALHGGPHAGLTRRGLHGGRRCAASESVSGAATASKRTRTGLPAPWGRLGPAGPAAAAPRPTLRVAPGAGHDAELEHR